MASSDELPDDDEKARFLVTMTRDDLAALDAARRKANVSRNRFIVLAVWKAINGAPEKCAICEKVDCHGH